MKNPSHRVLAAVMTVMVAGASVSTNGCVVSNEPEPVAAEADPTTCITKTFVKADGDVVWPGDGRVVKWEITVCTRKNRDGKTEVTVSQLGYDKDGHIVYGMGPGLTFLLDAGELRKILLDGKLPITGWFYYWDKDGNQQWIFPGQDADLDKWLVDYLMHLYWQWQQPSKKPPETTRTALNRAFDDGGVATVSLAVLNDTAHATTYVIASDDQVRLVESAVELGAIATQALAYMNEESDDAPLLPVGMATTTVPTTIDAPPMTTADAAVDAAAWGEAVVVWDADAIRIPAIEGRTTSRFELRVAADPDSLATEPRPLIGFAAYDALGNPIVTAPLAPIAVTDPDSDAPPGFVTNLYYHHATGIDVVEVANPAACSWLDSFLVGLDAQLVVLPTVAPYASTEVVIEYADALARATGDDPAEIRAGMMVAMRQQPRRDCSQYLADAVASTLATLVRAWVAYTSCKKANDRQCALRIYEAFTHALAASAHWLRYYACENNAPIPPAPPGGGAMPGMPAPPPGQAPPALPPPPKKP